MIKRLAISILFLYSLQTNAMMPSVCKIIQESACYPQAVTDALEIGIQKVITLPATSTNIEFALEASQQNSIGTTLAVTGLIGVSVAAGAFIGYVQAGRLKPLVVATMHGCEGLCIRFLLTLGANPFERSEIPYYNDDEDATEEDEESPTSSITTALHEAVCADNAHNLKLFLAHKRPSNDIDIQDGSGQTALHVAAMRECEHTPSCIELLLEHGASLQACDNYGYSPLHLAVLYSAHKTLKELLRLGADINAQDFNKDTPLHNACRNPDSRATVTLLQHGAAVDMRNAEGKTAYEVACYYENDKAASMLADSYAQRHIILALDTSEPRNPNLNCISTRGRNIATKLLNRELGNP